MVGTLNQLEVRAVLLRGKWVSALWAFFSGLKVRVSLFVRVAPNIGIKAEKFTFRTSKEQAYTAFFQRLVSFLFWNRFNNLGAVLVSIYVFVCFHFRLEKNLINKPISNLNHKLFVLDAEWRPSTGFLASNGDK